MDVLIESGEKTHSLKIVSHHLCDATVYSKPTGEDSSVIHECYTQAEHSQWNYGGYQRQAYKHLYEYSVGYFRAMPGIEGLQARRRRCWNTQDIDFYSF